MGLLREHPFAAATVAALVLSPVVGSAWGLIPRAVPGGFRDIPAFLVFIALAPAAGFVLGELVGQAGAGGDGLDGLSIKALAVGAVVCSYLVATLAVPLAEAGPAAIMETLLHKDSQPLSLLGRPLYAVLFGNPMAWVLLAAGSYIAVRRVAAKEPF